VRNGEEATASTIAGSTEPVTGGGAIPPRDESADLVAIAESYVMAAGEANLERDIVTVGIVEPSNTPWLRSVWLAVTLGIALA
jgi:hypothetical protein